VLSERREEAQIVLSLQTNADDYVTKPFSPHQLLARISALLRRTRRVRDHRSDELLAVGEVELNLIQMFALVNGNRVPLTPRELWLLHALMTNAGRVLNRDQLMRLAWGEQFIGVSKTVDVCVQRLRKKLAPHLTGACIHALRGFGYKFEADPAGGPPSGEREAVGALSLAYARR
jgi:DNA-binding response OmpR family regulator